MATLKEAARSVADAIRAGNGWAIIWKAGMHWHGASVRLDLFSDAFFPEDRIKALEILSAVPGAVMLDGASRKIFGKGMADAEIARAIRWHYGNGRCLLKDSGAFAPVNRPWREYKRIESWQRGLRHATD